MGIVNCRHATQDGEGWTALWEVLFLLRLCRKKRVVVVVVVVELSYSNRINT
jgi:hypothetical protein